MKNNSNTNKTLVGIAVAVVVLAALGIGGIVVWKNNSVSESTPTVSNQSANPTVTPLVQESSSPAASAQTGTEVKIVSVEAGNYYFKPNEIRVKKGEKVKIELSTVSMMHDFVIDELGVRIPVTPSGKTGSVEFTADKTGTYQFYCSVANHKQMGQVGTLIVE